jgi:hypothetical protein
MATPITEAEMTAYVRLVNASEEAAEARHAQLMAGFAEMKERADATIDKANRLTALKEKELTSGTPSPHGCSKCMETASRLAVVEKLLGITTSADGSSSAPRGTPTLVWPTFDEPELPTDVTQRLAQLKSDNVVPPSKDAKSAE